MQLLFLFFVWPVIVLGTVHQLCAVTRERWRAGAARALATGGE